MADIQVSPVADNTTDTPSSGARTIVWTTSLIGYAFYARSNVGTDGSIYYVKTTNGGQTWGSSTKVNSTTEAATATERFSIWYDQWTPGISTTKIHLTWWDAVAGESRYRALDTTNDSLGTEVIILASGVGPTHVPTIVRARGSNLYQWETATASRFLRRSVDDGANWTARAAMNSSGTARLMPGGETDGNDILMLLHRGTVLSLNVYDDSLDSWTIGATLDTNALPQAIDAEGVTRKSDNVTFIAYMLNTDGVAGNNSLRIVENTSGTTVTQRTNIFTNEADHSTANPNQVGIALDAFNGSDVYVGYAGIVGNASQRAYKKSTDGAVTWGAQITFGEDAVSRSAIWLAMNTALNGGRVYATWQEGVSVDIFGNFATSVALVGSGGGYPSQMHNKKPKKSGRVTQGLRVP